MWTYAFHRLKPFHKVVTPYFSFYHCRSRSALNLPLTIKNIQYIQRARIFSNIDPSNEQLATVVLFEKSVISIQKNLIHPKFEKKYSLRLSSDLTRKFIRTENIVSKNRKFWSTIKILNLFVHWKKSKIVYENIKLNAHVLRLHPWKYHWKCLSGFFFCAIFEKIRAASSFLFLLA